MNDEEDPAFGREVGDRLRNIRRQQGLSLHAVQAASGGEFKTSVLGAYERSDRIISVLRLQRLALLYGVPVEQLLPPSPPAPDVTDISGPDTPTSVADPAPVTIDLKKLKERVSPDEEILRRYIHTIQVQRGDFNGKVITIRNEDVRSLARVFERDVASMRHRFDELRHNSSNLRATS